MLFHDFFRAFEEPGVLEQPPEEVLLEYFRQYARLNEGMGMEYVQLLAIPKNREIFQGNENFELILENLLAGYQSDGRASRRRRSARGSAPRQTAAPRATLTQAKEKPWLMSMPPKNRFTPPIA